MELLQMIRESEIVYRLGWTLLHTLWLGAVVAVLLGAALLMLRRRSANARYLASCLALALMVALPVAAFFLVAMPTRSEEGASPAERSPAVASSGAVTEPVGSEGAPVAPAQAPVAGEAGPLLASATDPDPGPADSGAVWTGEPAAQPPPLLARASEAVKPALPWVVLAWVVGVLLLSFWHLGGWVVIQRLKRLAISQPGSDVIELTARLARTIGVSRPVKVVRSALAQVPTVAGWLRPVILLPVELATGLTPDQLRAVLAHELAHIRRYDYLVNLVQSVIETLLFYHPAVWFISKRIRAEREHCCDDMAVAAGAERISYAELLVDLARRSARNGGRAAAAAAVYATGKPSQLRERVRRLIGLAGPGVSRRATWLAGAIVIVGIGVASVVVYCHSSVDGRDHLANADLRRARTLVEIGDYAAALPQLRELVKTKPDNVEARRLIARAFGECDEPLDVPGLMLVGTNNTERALYHYQVLGKLGADGERALCKVITGGGGRLAPLAVEAAGRAHVKGSVGAIKTFLAQENLPTSYRDKAVAALVAIRGSEAAAVLRAQVVRINDRRRRYPVAYACVMALDPEGRLELAREETDHSLLAAVRNSLGRLPDMDEAVAIIALRHDVDVGLRQGALESLGSEARPDKTVFARTAAKLVEDESSGLRKFALARLVRIAPAAAIDSVLLASEDPQLSRAAYDHVRALEKILQSALRTRGLTHPEYVSATKRLAKVEREILLERLAEEAPHEAAEELRVMCRDPKVAPEDVLGVLRRTQKAIADYDEDVYVAMLRELVKHKAPVVRWYAALLAADAAKLPADALAYRRTAAEAFSALGKMKSPEAVRLLFKVLKCRTLPSGAMRDLALFFRKTPDQRVSGTFAREIGRIEPAAPVGLLAGAVKACSGDLSASAKEIAKGLASESSQVRANTIAALAFIGDKAVLPELEQAIQKTEAPDEKRQLSETIRRLGGAGVSRTPH